MLRAAVYARVSSVKQRDAESIKSQIGVLTAFVARQGWQLVGPYLDDGKSAKTGRLERRDGFGRLMVDAEAGRFDVLVVLDVSRLTRTNSIEERALILGPFQRLGIRLITPSGGEQDLRSFLGEFYVTLQALVSAEENRKRAEAIMAGKLRAIADGRKPAGPTPYAYRYDRAAGWSIEPDEAAVVREIFARVAAGESCETIARSLDARGIPRPRAGRWSRERVWSLATARTYLGRWIADHGRELSIPVPAIVGEADWSGAQRALTKARKRGISRSSHTYLLAGLGSCELCDSRIGVSTGSGPAADRVRQTYYVCASRRRPAWNGPRCDLPYQAAAELDGRVWSALVETICRRDLIERALTEHRAARARGRSSWRADLERATAGLDRLARTEAAILARFRAGRVSEAGLDAELAAQAAERAELEAAAAAAQAAGSSRSEAADVRAMSDSVDGLRRLVRARTTPADRRRLAVALLGDAGLTIGPAAVTATLRLRTGSQYTAGSNPQRPTSHGRILELRLVA
jgi:site-specific DNA recombinase